MNALRKKEFGCMSVSGIVAFAIGASEYGNSVIIMS